MKRKISCTGLFSFKVRAKCDIIIPEALKRAKAVITAVKLKNKDSKMKIENKSIYHQHNEIDEKLQKTTERLRVKRRNRSILMIIGILMILSILNMLSVGFYKEDLFSVKKHIIIMLGAFLVALIPAALNYKIYRKPFMKLLIFSGSIAVLLFIIIGAKLLPEVVKVINGATGWIDIGFTTVQPSEMLKIPFIILMANVLAKGEEKNLPAKIIVLNSFILFSIYGILIAQQNDLGTVIHYGAIYIFMLFLTKIDKNVIINLVVGGVALGLSGCYMIFKYADKIGNDYKLRRIKMFLEGLISDKYMGNSDIGYQVGQSLLAFGNGGLLGRTYGNGVQKYNYLPEIHTDFIMALFGEEMGFVGVLMVVILFFTLYNLMVDTGISSKDPFGRYLALGIAGYIISQFLINIFVALGLLPVFGIPMPIFSYGGSSIVTIFAGIGIVININKSMFDKE